MGSVLLVGARNDEDDMTGDGEAEGQRSVGSHGETSTVPDMNCQIAMHLHVPTEHLDVLQCICTHPRSIRMYRSEFECSK